MVVMLVDLPAAAVSTAVGLMVLLLAEVESVLAECAEAGSAQPRPGMGALILPLEVSADQPVHCDTTTEPAARLLLRHINSADGKTNR